ncbi:MAG: hypothetical protein HWN68_19845 [Desulfobacterales bacterium]|nr:hypothetical protein [Desulfobacterales bacterium]
MDRTLFAQKANLRRMAIKDDLSNLCKGGVLILRYEDGEPIYRMTEEFERVINSCGYLAAKIKAYSKDPFGGMALLALAAWYGKSKAEEAVGLWGTLIGVLNKYNLHAGLGAYT